MDSTSIRAYYERRGLPPADLEFALGVLCRLEDFLRTRNSPETPESLSVASLETFLAFLLEADGEISIPVFLALMRSMVAWKRTELYIFLTRYTGPDGVAQTIVHRARTILGDSAAEGLAAVGIPPLGTPPAEYPAFTARFMKRMKEVCPNALLESVLAGNNHQIPDSAEDGEKAFYEQAPTLEAYLKGRHDRQVAILRRHCEEKRVWFEQEITPGVLALVENNQEIQSAVLKDGKLYATKIPYDGKSLLAETDPLRRRYHACHCPFVREAIQAGRTDLDPDWCLCSAGFEKHLFECLFGRSVPIKVLNSVLLGDEFCRFEMDLAGIPYKK